MPSATLKQTGGEFARFFVVGVGATLLHLAVYLLLNWVCDLSEKDALGITLTYSAAPAGVCYRGAVEFPYGALLFETLMREKA